MTSYVFWPFLTYLPTISHDFYLMLSDIWRLFGPLYLTSLMYVSYLIVKNKYAPLWLFFLYYAVFLKVYFHKVPSVAVFLCYDNRLKPFQWKNARPFYVLELWVGLNTFHKSYLHLVFITLFTVKEMRCYFS